MTTEYKLREWPQRISVEQDDINPSSITIYDADTHEPLNAVFRVVIVRNGSEVQITQSKYEPHKPVILENEPWKFPEMSGFIVETRAYPITRLSLEAGA